MYVARDEIKRSGCGIINVSSIGSTKYYPVSVYSSTKAAVDNLTRCMSVEFGQYKIRVNAINPSLVLGTDIVGEHDISEFINGIKSTTPIGELTSVSDCAELVVFLLSEKSKAINGRCIIIDGGIACK